MRETYKDYGYASDRPSYPHAYLLGPVLRMLRGTRGAVLDVGCGNGALARELSAQGFDVYGIDASESGIALANSSGSGRFFVGNIDDGELPEPLRQIDFDAVVTTEVIEHLYDPASLLRLSRRALVPGGRLVLSTPYHGYLKNLALAATGRLDEHFTALWTGGHIKFFSRHTLSQLLAEQEFRVEAFAGAGRVPYLWKSMVLRARAPA